MDDATQKAWDDLKKDFKTTGSFQHDERACEPFIWHRPGRKSHTALTPECLRAIVIAQIARPAPRGTT